MGRECLANQAICGTPRHRQPQGSSWSVPLGRASRDCEVDRRNRDMDELSGAAIMRVSGFAGRFLLVSTALLRTRTLSTRADLRDPSVASESPKQCTVVSSSARGGAWIGLLVSSPSPEARTRWVLSPTGIGFGTTVLVSCIPIRRSAQPEGIIGAKRWVGCIQSRPRSAPITQAVTYGAT